MTTHIYGLSDPRNGEIRYVGYSQNLKRRCKQHLEEAIKEKDRHTHKLHWIRSLLNERLTFQVVLIEENISNPNLRERYWIKVLKQRGCSLTNSTDGGEGLFNPAPELIQRITETSKRVWSDPDLRKKNGARVSAGYTPKARQRQARAAKLRWKKGVYESTAFKVARQKQSLKDALREKAQARWNDPDFRERTIQNMRKAHKRPEVQANRSAASKALWKDPKYRKKVCAAVSEGISQWHQDRKAKIPEIAPRLAAAISEAIKK